MSPWFTKIIHREPRRSQSTKEIIHAREIRTETAARNRIEIPFVVKYVREPIEKVLSWRNASNELAAMGVPVVKFEEIKETSRGVYVKQRDYSASLKREIFEASEMSRIDPKLMMDIVTDMAKMHSRGYITKAGEYLLTPWLVYKTPRGELERVLVDFGSLSKHDSQEYTHNGKRRSRSETDFSYLLPKLQGYDRPATQKILERYFSINPNPVLKSMASSFFGYNF